MSETDDDRSGPPNSKPPIAEDRSRADGVSPAAAPLSLSYSRTFPALLAELGCALGFSTYQAGRIFLVGLTPEGSVRATELSFPRSMGIGLSADARQLFLATQHQIYRFDDFLAPGEVRADGADAVFVPRLSWVTGDLDAHDIAPGARGRPVFVNTAFNCLATVSAGYSFRPIWKPKFITGLVHEDRCHLNGMALEAGTPRYVTLCARSDTQGGWRDRRRDGGLIMDITDGRVVCEGLSMPHSPRVYRGQLWVLNSGTGHFGRIDLARGAFEPVTLCPGYARGLAFAGDHAFIGLSGPRDERLFGGLALEDALRAGGREAQCSVVAVNLATGRIEARLTLPDPIRELYDVQVLPGLRCPVAIGFRTDEIRRMIAIDG